ncbi:peptide deformylase [Mycetocola reblochoni]|uniref:Peptide deformylase n=2 Tax=Mycetocola reblochoni TaxID=331618 RepID=A0A1R4K484_9MICO|nr:peptide deformylase [Mycetocola reblochoni]RLP69875.1 peptide deformylase [Mycetocola reblochoni]SJN39127.1 Peptide deformylase [Mycetocola reblochoni REB411]
MAILPIRIAGDPVLHSPAAPVTSFDESLHELISDMFETMDAAPGVGLAAPQVGVGLRLFVYSYPDDDGIPWRGVAINPELWITPAPAVAGGEDDEEGCLSFPGERYPLVRSEHARLRAVDGDNSPIDIAVSGWRARILQHEFDHLDGSLYLDRLDSQFDRSVLRTMRKRGWGRPEQAWTPGFDQLEG